MRQYLKWSAAATIFIASSSDAQPGPGLSSAVNSVAVQRLATDAQQQAQQAEQVAQQLSTSPAADAPEILRQAELNGVGLAWFSRMRMTERPIGAAVDESASTNERNSAIDVLRKQAADLTNFAQRLQSAVAKTETVQQLIETVEDIVVPSAAMIAYGTPGAPDPDAQGPIAELNEPTAVEMLVAGGGGAATSDYPSVGAIVIEQSGGVAGGTTRDVGCTGTLVSPRVVVTAGHCVTPEHGGGRPVEVFFQHAGRFAVTAAYPERPETRHRQYGLIAGQPVNDLAVLQLDRPVTTIRPAAVMQPGEFLPGEQGTIVGFGYRSALDPQGAAVPGSTLVQRTGLKLVGVVETRLCQGIAGLSVTDPRICWEFKGDRPQSATVCRGDSGGPLFVRRGTDWLLAGVTSFGFPRIPGNPCPPSSFAVDIDLSAHRQWLGEQITALDSTVPNWPSTTLNPVRNAPDRYLSGVYLPAGLPTITRSIPVTAPGQVLAVAINGTAANAETTLRLMGPDGSVACEGAENEPLVYCTAPQPPTGKWRLQVTGHPAQEFQLTAVLF